MKKEDIELQLWAYIDAICTEAERGRVEKLIEHDVWWKELYNELMILNSGIATVTEPDQPSMRFSKNIMEAIAATQVKKPTRQYINTAVVKGIGAFFIIIIIACFIYMTFTAQWEGDTSAIVSKSNLMNGQISGFFNSTVFNVMVLVNIVLVLVFADKLVRRRKSGYE